MADKQRMRGTDRRANLLNIAYALAARDGIAGVTRKAVATEAQVTEPLINHYFKGTAAMQALVIDKAAELKDCKILASAIRSGWDLSSVAATRATMREAKRIAAA